MRARPTTKTFALSMSHDGMPRHYIVDYDRAKFFIDDGPKFDNVVEVINAHLHSRIRHKKY